MLDVPDLIKWLRYLGRWRPEMHFGTTAQQTCNRYADDLEFAPNFDKFEDWLQEQLDLTTDPLRRLQILNSIGSAARFRAVCRRKRETVT